MYVRRKTSSFCTVLRYKKMLLLQALHVCTPCSNAFLHGFARFARASSFDWFAQPVGFPSTPKPKKLVEGPGPRRRQQSSSCLTAAGLRLVSRPAAALHAGTLQQGLAPLRAADGHGVHGPCRCTLPYSSSPRSSALGRRPRPSPPSRAARRSLRGSAGWPAAAPGSSAACRCPASLRPAPLRHGHKDALGNFSAGPDKAQPRPHPHTLRAVLGSAAFTAMRLLWLMTSVVSGHPGLEGKSSLSLALACSRSLATMVRARCVFPVPGRPVSSRELPARQWLIGSSTPFHLRCLGRSASMRGARLPSNGFVSSTR